MDPEEQRSKGLADTLALLSKYLIGKVEISMCLFRRKLKQNRNMHAKLTECDSAGIHGKNWILTQCTSNPELRNIKIFLDLHKNRLFSYIKILNFI